MLGSGRFFSNFVPSSEYPNLFIPKLSYYFIILDADGVIEVLEGYKLSMDVYGHGFTKDSQVILSTSIGELGEDCKSDETHIKTNLYFLSNVSPDGTSAILLVSVTIVFEFEEAELIYVLPGLMFGLRIKRVTLP